MLERVKNDFYPSPSALIKAYLALGIDSRPMFHGELLEPCVGAGDISNALVDAGHNRVTCTDIVDGEIYDATKKSYWDSLEYRPDWVITNPPFNLASPIIRHSLGTAKRGVIMLLRLSYMEPCKDRRDILDSGLTHITIVNPRPKFRADTKGSDSSTVAFFVWQKGTAYGAPVNMNYLVDWNRSTQT